MAQEFSHFDVHGDFNDSAQIVLVLVVKVDQILDQAFGVALLQLVEYKLARSDICRSSRHVGAHQPGIKVVDWNRKGFLR